MYKLYFTHESPDECDYAETPFDTREDAYRMACQQAKRVLDFHNAHVPGGRYTIHHGKTTVVVTGVWQGADDLHVWMVL